MRMRALRFLACPVWAGHDVSINIVQSDNLHDPRGAGDYSLK